MESLTENELRELIHGLGYNAEAVHRALRELFPDAGSIRVSIYTPANDNRMTFAEVTIMSERFVRGYLFRWRP